MIFLEWWIELQLVYKQIVKYEDYFYNPYLCFKEIAFIPLPVFQTFLNKTAVSLVSIYWVLYASGLNIFYVLTI